MKKIILASILALFLMVGIGCVAAADFNLNNAHGDNPNNALIDSDYDGNGYLYMITLGERPFQSSNPGFGDGMCPKIPFFPNPVIYGGGSGNDNLA